MKTNSPFGADFIVIHSDKFVLLEDLNHGNKSVTNDAEAVVDIVLEKYGNDKRIFYIDSSGFTDELCHDGKGFTNFSPGIPDDYLQELYG